MSRSKSETIRTIDEAAADQVMTAMAVDDFRNVIVAVSVTGFTGTVKFQGSIKAKQGERVDFSAAATSSNPWDYVQVKELQNDSAVAGDTGVAFSAITGVTLYEVNVNALKWFGVEVSGHAGGTVSVDVFCTGN